MQNKKSKYRIIFFWLAISIFSLTNVLANDSVHYKIVDNNNNVTIVRNLNAFYAGKGQWIGKRPEERKSSLRFEYFIKKTNDSTNNTGQIEIFFKDLKSLKYDVIVNKKWIWRYILEKKNGTIITLSSEKYEEINEKGDIVLSKNIDDKKCVAFYWSDIPVELFGFYATLQNDEKEEEYYIGIDYVREIHFDVQEP